MDVDDYLARAGKASFRAGVASLLGLALVISALFYSSLKLRTLQNNTANAARKLETTQAELKAADENLRNITEEIAIANEQRRRLNIFRQKLQSPLTEQLEVKTNKVQTDQSMADGRKLYDFAVWVEAPKPVLDRIDSVEYRFEHPSFRQHSLSSYDESTGFRVQYRGWGCMDVVPIIIHPKLSAATGAIDFDMCAKLQDSAATKSPPTPQP
jgi:DNA primase